MQIKDADHVAQALALVRQRIARACSAGRDPSDIAILAVTKGFGSSAPEAALAAGLRQLGENYYQEAFEKYAQLPKPEGTALHFIGRVQRNKARRIATLFDVVQTVDDLRVARTLDEAAGALGKTLAVLIQVNVARDQRQGVAEGELPAFLEDVSACRNLVIRGLMAIGPHDAAHTSAAFISARACFDRLRVLHPEMDTLSMGMSEDLEAAVAAGSTMVRIGSALFGPRPVRPHR